MLVCCEGNLDRDNACRMCREREVDAACKRRGSVRQATAAVVCTRGMRIYCSTPSLEANCGLIDGGLGLLKCHICTFIKQSHIACQCQRPLCCPAKQSLHGPTTGIGPNSRAVRPMTYGERGSVSAGHAMGIFFRPFPTRACPPPPPHHPVGPNFSHHKARVQAVGWFPLGTRK